MLIINTDKDFSLSRLSEVAECVWRELKQKEPLYAELDFVSARRIHKVNRETRGVDAVTDVLSFPMLVGIKGKVVTRKEHPFDFDEDANAIFLGTVLINMQRVKSQAKAFGHSEEREAYYLIVHALLHLFGFDHVTESDKREMREKEEKIM
ncbi:MAG: rRNA maturation RNase YbeY, partial [Clostridia bacterium]|nr:rRNA maturation RNase YbeY [Clostridia bacterium]